MKQIVYTAILLTIMGCGDGGGGGVGYQELQLTPAAGIVIVNGKPFSGAVVTFYPPSGVIGIGKTDSEGKFEVSTNGQPGVCVGVCQVTVVDGDETERIGNAMMGGNVGGAESNREKIPAKYKMKSTTDLSVIIVEGDSENLTLDLAEGE